MSKKKIKPGFIIVLVIIIVIVLGGAGYGVYYLLKKGRSKDKESDKPQSAAALTYNEQVALLVAKIKSDPEWAAYTRREAQKYNKTYDERLVYNAEWYLQRYDIDYLLNLDWK